LATSQFFFSPREPGRVIGGVEPPARFPTTSDRTRGFQDWGAGVIAMALDSEGPMLTAVLINQIWFVD